MIARWLADPAVGMVAWIYITAGCCYLSVRAEVWMLNCKRRQEG